jgi:hypothetical protein
MYEMVNLTRLQMLVMWMLTLESWRLALELLWRLTLEPGRLTLEPGRLTLEQGRLILEALNLILYQCCSFTLIFKESQLEQ